MRSANGFLLLAPMLAATTLCAPASAQVIPLSSLTPPPIQPATKPLDAAKVKDLTPEDVELCNHVEVVGAPFGDVASAADIASFCARLTSSPISLLAEEPGARALHEKRACDAIKKDRPTELFGCQDADLLSYCEDPKRAPSANQSCAPVALKEYFKLDGQAVAATAASTTPLVLNGVTDFFLARAQQEMLVFLRDRLVGDLCKAGPWKKLLPSTCQALAPGGSTSSSNTLLGLPSAMRDDLESLPVALIDIAPPSPFMCLARGSLGLVEPVRQGLPLSTAVRGLPEKAPAACKDPALWADLRTTAAVLADYLEGIEGQTGLSQADLGLALSQLTLTLRAKAPGSTPDTAWIQSNLAKFARLSLALERVKKSNGSEASVREALIASFDITAELLVHVTSRSTDPAVQGLGNDIRTVAKAAEAFASRDYTAAMLRLFAVPSLSTAFEDALGLDESTRGFVAKLTLHAQLIAALAQAKNAEDAQKALEAAAAPLGSWREYRRRGRAGFLGGMLGVGGGYEVALSKGGSDGATLSPFLPIGLEIGLTDPGPSSLNLLFSVIDLGALASIRLQEQSGGDSGTDKQAKAVPDATFLSVFAPGVTLAWGIGDTPFVLGGGLAFAPAHRQFFACADTCGKTDTLATLRLHAFVGIDLPVLPLF